MDSLLDLIDRSPIDFYADESSQCAHQYLVLGVLSARTKNIPEIVKQFTELRQKHKMPGELKWNKVTNQKVHVYQEWIELFFKLASDKIVRFNCMVVDTTQFDHKTYNEGDSEIGFNKMIYQLLLHRIGIKFGRICHLYGYLDSRTTTHTPENLRRMLNAGLAKHHRINSNPFRRLVFRDSKKCDLIQTVDILTGAIAFERNQHSKNPDARKAKIDLCNLILNQSTQKPIRWQFKIWNFEFQNRVPQA